MALLDTPYLFFVMPFTSACIRAAWLLTIRAVDGVFGGISDPSRPSQAFCFWSSYPRLLQPSILNHESVAGLSFLFCMTWVEGGVQRDSWAASDSMKLGEQAQQVSCGPESHSLSAHAECDESQLCPVLSLQETCHKATCRS